MTNTTNRTKTMNSQKKKLNIFENHLYKIKWKEKNDLEEWFCVKKKKKRERGYFVNFRVAHSYNFESKDNGLLKRQHFSQLTFSTTLIKSFQPVFVSNLYVNHYLIYHNHIIDSCFSSQTIIMYFLCYV